MKPGIYYSVSESDYHAGESDAPALSSSIAKILCSQSPKHAWTAHPRLNPNYKRVDTDAFDRGIVAHALLLQGMNVAAPLPFDDWRKKEAREARDAAREIGKIPMKESQFAEVSAMVEAVALQLVDFARPVPFTKGKPEVTLIWEDEGVRCKARLDWLRDDDGYTIDDFKTLADANPETITRKALSDGWDIQAAFYCRGIEVLTGINPSFRFIAAEIEPPYATTVNRLDEMFLEMGHRKRRFAMELWKKCLDSGEWPTYDKRTALIPLPVWEEKRWSDKELLSLGIQP